MLVAGQVAVLGAGELLNPAWRGQCRYFLRGEGTEPGRAGRVCAALCGHAGLLVGDLTFLTRRRSVVHLKTLTEIQAVTGLTSLSSMDLEAAAEMIHVLPCSRWNSRSLGLAAMASSATDDDHAEAVRHQPVFK
jgi:hypothetical protein